MTEAPTDRLEPAPAAKRVRSRAWLLLSTAGVLLVLDQLSKVWALQYLGSGRSVAVWEPVLALRLVRNPGAAFSMGESFTWGFTVLASLVVVLVVAMAHRVHSRVWGFTLGLLLAGAAGNLADRLFRPPSFGRGHVIDFIDYGGRFVGNVADIAIVAAMILMMLAVLRGIGLDGSKQ